MFRPSLRELIDELKANPKRFSKKRGKIDDARAADVTFRNGVVWRAVFTLHDAPRVVRVLSLGPHDDAYADAARRP